MVALEDRFEIEQLVGAGRHPTLHIARADTASRRVYLLHSQSCLDTYDLRPSDLRACPFSAALDNVETRKWHGHEDEAVVVTVTYDGFDGKPRLTPDLARRP